MEQFKENDREIDFGTIYKEKSFQACLIDACIYVYSLTTFVFNCLSVTTNIFNLFRYLILTVLKLFLQNSREEVTTATAYLDLFLRKVSEPSLIKAFLMFIFTEKNDEIVILDSLITRINSSSKVSCT